MAYTITTKAPVGPPIWTRDPPSAEIRNPPTIAVKRPRSGVTPQRDDADDYPRDRVGEKLLAGVTLQRSDELRNEPVQVSLPGRRPVRI
jgi:hypothetical protein